MYMYRKHWYHDRTENLLKETILNAVSVGKFLMVHIMIKKRVCGEVFFDLFNTVGHVPSSYSEFVSVGIERFNLKLDKI